jgi:hypothetical protein
MLFLIFAIFGKIKIVVICLPAGEASLFTVIFIVLQIW